MDTLHTDDLATALVALAAWTASRSRSEADSLAGSSLPPCRPPHGRFFARPSKASFDDKEIEALAPRTSTQRAPLFNITDGGQTTMGDIVEAVGKAVGVKTTFTNTLVSSFAKGRSTLLLSLLLLIAGRTDEHGRRRRGDQRYPRHRVHRNATSLDAAHHFYTPLRRSSRRSPSSQPSLVRRHQATSPPSRLATRSSSFRRHPRRRCPLSMASRNNSMA